MSDLNIKDYLVFHDESESLYDKLALESYLSFLQPKSEKLPGKVIPIDIPFIEPKKETKIEYVPSKGEKSFEEAYIRAVGKKDEYYDFLKNVAKYESGFNPKAKNPGAPAYGYFQFMQDGIKWNNISRFAGVDIETFRNTPELQILAARRLYDEFKKSFNSRDLVRAKELGLSEKQLVGGAWLAGAGGVKNYLHHGKNVDDKHWNNGVGIDLLTQFKRFARKGGVLKLQKGNPLYHTMIARSFTGGDYDYSGADKMPDSTGHWQSRDPQTGLLLKSSNHSTYGLQMYGEWKAGNDLRRNFLTGMEYSLTNDILPVLFSERVDYNNLDLYKGRIPTVDDLVNFIVSYEDFESKPYKLKDQLLIGHGLSDMELINRYKDIGIPEDVSRSEVVKRVNSILASHEQRLPGFKDLPQNVKLAIVDIVYNGKGDNELLSSDPKSPNLKAAIASGNLFKIISEMNHSQTADGWLGIRSAARRAMALGDYDWDYEYIDSKGRHINPNKVSDLDYLTSPYLNYIDM